MWQSWLCTQRARTACSANTYKSVTGSSACQSCPSNSFSAAGASSCFCNAGYFGPANGPCTSTAATTIRRRLEEKRTGRANDSVGGGRCGQRSVPRRQFAARARTALPTAPAAQVRSRFAACKVGSRPMSLELTITAARCGQLWMEHTRHRSSVCGQYLQPDGRCECVHGLCRQLGHVWHRFGQPDAVPLQCRLFRRQWRPMHGYDHGHGRLPVFFPPAAPRRCAAVDVNEAAHR